VAGLGNMMITLGSIFIGIFSAMICYGVLDLFDYYDGKIFNPIFPTIVIFQLRYLQSNDV